jgi:5-methylcytosine-specific restriction endonuclease McrA
MKALGKRGKRLAPARAIFRRKVYENARGRCELCGEPGHEAHHIITTHWLTTKDVHDPRNGAFLCNSCHNHGKGFAFLWKVLAAKRQEDVKWLRTVCPFVVNKYLGESVK